MLGFNFRQRIRNWLMGDEQEQVIRHESLSVDHHSLDSNSIRLHVYPANGGTVIETRTYDPVKDRNHTGLYVIHSEADMGEEIAKIITMTSLSRL